MKVERKVKLQFFAVVLIGILAFSLGYVFASGPTTMQYNSGGVNSGAPTYTAWQEGSTFFAKDSFGALLSGYSAGSSNATTIIQGAINDMPNNGKILIKQGTYPANLSITKPIIIEGEGTNATIIRGQIDCTMATPQRQVLLIRNLALIEPSLQAGTKAIYLNNLWNPRIENVLIQNYSIGIELEATHSTWAYGTLIDHCIFYDVPCTISILGVEYDNYPNIVTLRDSDMIIDSTSSYYKSGSYAVYVDPYEYNLAMENNNIFGYYAIVLLNSTTFSIGLDDFIFQNNYIEQTLYGIKGAGSPVDWHYIQNVEMEGNLLPTNYMFYHIGIASAHIQNILAGSRTSPLKPDNPSSEWTIAYFNISSGTSLSAGSNFFGLRSSNKSFCVTYSSYIINVVSAGGLVQPFSVVANDYRNYQPGYIQFFVIIKDAFTLTSDFVFSIQIVYP